MEAASWLSSILSLSVPRSSFAALPAQCSSPTAYAAGDELCTVNSSDFEDEHSAAAALADNLQRIIARGGDVQQGAIAAISPGSRWQLVARYPGIGQRSSHVTPAIRMNLIPYRPSESTRDRRRAAETHTIGDRRRAPRDERRGERMTRRRLSRYCARVIPPKYPVHWQY